MTVDLRAQLQSTLGDAFTLERELGGGGMSRVFVATETALGRKVVVKVLAPELAQGMSTERFRREILLAAGLQHPAIVPVLASGAADGLPFYTMPFVQGESLRQRLARGPLPVGEAVGVLRDVASALDYAHERGVVHRDIKPENILLSGSRAMVTDFGIARALRQATQGGGFETLTATGFAIGTPAYMSPEQVVGDRELDSRSDIYSLGCVVYETLAGESPFAGPSGLVVARRFTQPPPALSSRRPDLPAALDTVLARALALNPAERYATAGELARAVEEAVPVASTPSDAVEAARTPDRPHGGSGDVQRRAAGAIVAILVLAALAAGGWWWLAERGRTAAEPPRKMLAVLPFKNLGRAEDEYFADGVTEVWDLLRSNPRFRRLVEGKP